MFELSLRPYGTRLQHSRYDLFVGALEQFADLQPSGVRYAYVRLYVGPYNRHVVSTQMGRRVKTAKP